MLKILFFIWGTLIGSFINVCVYRMPRSESIVFPGSHCVYCGKAIKWYENIPLVSYIFLRGRCSSCGKPISVRYFIIEALTGILFLLFYSRFGLGLDLLFFLILVFGLMVATFIDFEHQLIPDSVSLGGLVFGPLIAILYPEFFGVMARKAALLDSLAGAAAGGLLIYLIGLLGKAIFKREAMGFGDVKFLAMIGAFLGWKKVLLVFFLAPFFGSAVGIFLKIKYKTEIIPYGPYLSLAAVLVILYGDRILGRLFLGLVP